MLAMSQSLRGFNTFWRIFSKMLSVSEETLLFNCARLGQQAPPILCWTYLHKKKSQCVNLESVLANFLDHPYQSMNLAPLHPLSLLLHWCSAVRLRLAGKSCFLVVSVQMKRNNYLIWANNWSTRIFFIKEIWFNDSIKFYGTPNL